LRSPKFVESDVARGKTNLKAAVFAVGDSSSALHDNVGQQLIFSSNVSSISSIADEIDSISAADVKHVKINS
jgi:hypothetical protein